MGWKKIVKACVISILMFLIFVLMLVIIQNFVPIINSNDWFIAFLIPPFISLLAGGNTVEEFRPGLLYVLADSAFAGAFVGFLFAVVYVGLMVISPNSGLWHASGIDVLMDLVNTAEFLSLCLPVLLLAGVVFGAFGGFIAWTWRFIVQKATEKLVSPGKPKIGG